MYFSRTVGVADGHLHISVQQTHLPPIALYVRGAYFLHSHLQQVSRSLKAFQLAESHLKHLSQWLNILEMFRESH
jgi:hypothetical protein